MASKNVVAANTEKGFASVSGDAEKRGSKKNVDMLEKEYGNIVNELRQTYSTGKTKSLAWRRKQLKAIVRMTQENSEKMVEAIRADLGGAKIRGLFDLDANAEALMALKHLDEWAKDEPVPDPNLFGKSYIRKEPKGVVLLIAPWNFPISLTFRPLVSILAAGNCCVIKPSEVSSHSAKLIQELVEAYLPSDAVRVVQGSVAETTALLRLRYDHIMYTGNGFVARIVMKAAANHLTPTTLELGGKSPVFVDSTAKLKLAAKRIVLSKFACNNGQICIAPDYVVVDEKRKDEFVSALKDEVVSQLGEPPYDRAFKSETDRETRAFGKIINSRHVKRIASLLEDAGGKIALGDVDSIDAERCYVPPLIVEDPNAESKLLREEIFGPVLPVVGVKNLDEAVRRVNKICDHPLALYIFSESNRNVREILDRTTSGGVCVNSTLEQIVNQHLPFGGVGESGMGAYHGKRGFDEFSHKRSVLERTTVLPLTALPPPSAGNFPGWLYAMALRQEIIGFLPSWLAKLLRPLGMVLVAWIVYALLRSRK